jgi:hypothetical protein
MLTRRPTLVRQDATLSPGDRPEEPAVDLLVTLQQLSVRLERLAVTDEMPWARACELVERINQVAGSTTAALLREYVLGTQHPEDFRKEEIWSTVTDYLARLVGGYQWCLGRYEFDVAPGQSSASVLAPVAASAIRACAAQLKWAYLRYYPVAPMQWRTLAGIYLAAERAGVASEAFPLRGGPESSSTVEREFLKTIVLAASSPGGLLPAQIEVAEHLIEQCASQLGLMQHALEPVHYFIDLTATDGPQRLLPSKELSGAGRVIVLTPAVVILQQLAADVDQGSLTAADLNLDPLCSSELVRATAHHLLRYWDRPPLERRHLRRRDTLRVAVVHDFDEVAAKVVGATTKNPAGGDQEYWPVEDRSAAGLLAVLSRRQGRWIGAGSLIAFRFDDQDAWHAGIIRRVQREDEETRHVGIEKLITEIWGVTLVRRFRREPDEPFKTIVGIFLIDSSAPANSVTLLLPTDTFSPSAPLEMHMGSRVYLLVPQELIESGHDYQIARYKKLDSCE